MIVTRRRVYDHYIYCTTEGLKACELFREPGPA